MQLVSSLHTYAEDIHAQKVWNAINEYLVDIDGIAYYRYPNLGSGKGILLDFAILTKTCGVIVVSVVKESIDELCNIEDDQWFNKYSEESTPILDLEDFGVSLKYKFDQVRELRNKIPIVHVLALPSITRNEFISKFGDIFPQHIYLLWRGNLPESPFPSNLSLDDVLWKLAKSTFQSASVLMKGNLSKVQTGDTLGEAIRILEKDIALFDEQQEKVAIQIPPGPQMIRGLAGTGKTVLLAMKAANIHMHFPDKRILFTFNTQSLYNQAKRLITDFYRFDKNEDPDWSVLHIRHGWGGSYKKGVYSDICSRHGEAPLTFRAARQLDPNNAFNACCKHALSMDLCEYYDYILVDEAQDFPKEFFQVLYRLSTPPHCIYFAFDELQSLTTLEMPTSRDLFGVDENGEPLVNLDGEYQGPMDKILVLSRSYRCPHKVLMLAHGLGLGIHSAKGCVQMISDAYTWRSIGYDIVEGELIKDHGIKLYRPTENSPNRIEKIYTGKRGLIIRECFDEREEELAWVAEQINIETNEEKVPPERIIVISLDSKNSKSHMSSLQRKLYEKGIASVVPGLIDDSDEFAEDGKVTLSTVFRAKGNEAPIIYIICFDELISYVQEVETRNKAFTSITRAKACIRISGVGDKMKAAIKEIDCILSDVPHLQFIFPDMEKIKRNLDPRETTRRMAQVKRAKKNLSELSNLDVEAVIESDPEKLEELIGRINRAKELRGEN